MNIKLLSLNVRGLRNSDKRRQIFRWLKRFHDGGNCFTFLQETHSTHKDEEIWKREWGSKISFSHGSSVSKGVAILFPLKYNCNVIEELQAESGRKLTLHLDFDGERVTLVNLYAPTQDNTEQHLSFIRSLREDICDTNCNVIFGGDFNLYISNELDKDKGASQQFSPAATELSNILNETNYIDIWRVKNPDKRRYTWRRNNPLVQSRLDYWLIPTELIYDVEKCNILPSIKTDHSLITLCINSSNDGKRGPGLWKFNDALLKDEYYVYFMKDKIKKLKQEHCSDENKAMTWELIKMEIRNSTIAYSKQKSKMQKQVENYLNAQLEILSETLDNKYDDAVDER